MTNPRTRPTGVPRHPRRLFVVLPFAVAAADRPASAASHTWQNVATSGGGDVTGVVCRPTTASLV